MTCLGRFPFRALVLAACLAAAAAQSSAPAAGGPCPYDPSFTAADCPLQSCWAAPPNGCGSRSVALISPQIVPDSWPAGVDFNAACNAHDLCYFSPGTTKPGCDAAFHEAMLAECRRALACTDVPILGRQCTADATQNPLWEPCQVLADTYFGAVQSIGHDSFDRDQAEAGDYAGRCRAAAARRAG